MLNASSPPSHLPHAPSWGAFLSFAFRPLYLLAAVQGAVSVLAWVSGWMGTPALPGLFWHGHEMIWGYAGAIIVGFLLTAVATWTGQPPVRGGVLALLVGQWLAARLLFWLVPHSVVPGAVFSVMFFCLAAVLFARPILLSRNLRNLLPVALLLGLGAADALFLITAAGYLAFDARALLHAGLLLVAVVIFLMGSRVIPFFTAKRLHVEQVRNSPLLLIPGIVFPLLLAVGVVSGAPIWALAALAVVGGGANLLSMLRWWRAAVVREPMLWVLYVGFAFPAVGVMAYGLMSAFAPAWVSAGVHLIAIGGIGVLTIGMMTRTALGHTGRPISAPPGMMPAFALAALATVLRVASVLLPALYMPLVIASGVSLAAALCVFVVRFGPWLICPRADAGRG